MPKSRDAILRNAEGEFMLRLAPEDVEVYEVLAERGQVERMVKSRKGQRQIIFKMKPMAILAEPSESVNSQCSLNENDSIGFAALSAGFSDQRTSRFQIERWAGYGLLSGVTA